MDVNGYVELIAEHVDDGIELVELRAAAVRDHELTPAQCASIEERIDSRLAELERAGRLPYEARMRDRWLSETEGGLEVLAPEDIGEFEPIVPPGTVWNPNLAAAR